MVRMSRRVMFYVQHLLGVGHLKRASLLARAMADAGLDVSVVLGGPEVPDVGFDGCARFALPAARAADETFSVLLDEHGNPVDDAWRDGRMVRLTAVFDAVRPDVLLVEQFPFGRRQFRFELMPLLEQARTASNRPYILSSIRDVLVRKSDPKREREMVTLAQTWFDRVLVHGDPRVIPLEASFPRAADIGDKLAYTGYVIDPDDLEDIARGRESGRGEVVVSVGGGAVGEPLLRTALAARPLSRLGKHVWRLVTGPNLPDSRYDELAWDLPPGVVVERWRSDLPILLRNCVLSISQGGYNTIMDILRSRARAVIVPFAAGTETEQEFRARVLEERGLVTVVDPGSLSPENLAKAVDLALDKVPAVSLIDLKGAETTARIVAEYCGGVNERE
jgi:predicted glycosyltransferase